MPLKKKLNSSTNLEQAKIICERNNILVYPVLKNGFWYVEVSINGSIKTIKKEIGSGAALCSKKRKYKDIDWVKSIEKTIIFYASKFNLLESNRGS